MPKFDTWLFPLVAVWPRLSVLMRQIKGSCVITDASVQGMS